jgi:hypothetical protein
MRRNSGVKEREESTAFRRTWWDRRLAPARAFDLPRKGVLT